MTKYLLVTFFIALFTASPSTEDGDIVRGEATVQAETRVLWHEAKVLLPTEVYYPPGFEEGSERTLVVVMHGLSETASASACRAVAEDFAAGGYLVAVPEAAYPILVEDRIGYDWALWTRGDRSLSERAHALAGLEQIPAMVADLQRRHRIDRVCLFGFSQGAVLALWTAINNSGLVDGVVSFAPPAFDVSWYPDNTLQAGGCVKVLLVHGTEDRKARLAASESARKALEGADYDVTFHSFDGGHTVPAEVLGQVAEWMDSAFSR